MKKCLIFDGRNMLWRTGDAFSNLSVDIGDDEIAVGGIYGFLSVSMLKHVKYGGKVVVAWEGKNNFRYRLYSDYKKKKAGEIDAAREIFKRELLKQEIRVKALLRSIGVDQYNAVGCEADDVMGTLAKKYSKAGSSVIIYTGDSDLRQVVVDKKIAVVSPGFRGKDTTFDTAKSVQDKHKVKPALLSDLKALAGDSSDNIPGIHGVGDVTASKLLNQYGNVERVIVAAESGAEDWPVNKKFMNTIAEQKSQLRIYKKLTTILMNCEVERISPQRDEDRVRRYLNFYKFRSLLSNNEFQQLMEMGNG